MINLKCGIFNFLYWIHCFCFNDNSNFSKRKYLIFLLNGLNIIKLENNT